MSISECKECGVDVSDSAPFCPKCGVPAPTIVFSKNSPKCNLDGCYNFAGVREKHNGMCFDHYEANKNKSIIIWFIVIAVFVLFAGLL